MKNFISLLLIVILFGCNSVKKTNLEEKENHSLQIIENKIKSFFDAFHESKSEQIKTFMNDEVILKSIYINKSGETVIQFSDVLEFYDAVEEFSKKQKWKEEILEYKINVDGDLAMAWTPYKFYVNEKFTHCGVNLFTLVKINSNWEIIAITDTRKTKDCDKL